MDTMTPKQGQYLRTLVEQRLAGGLAESWGITPEQAAERFVQSVESKHEASRIIDELQKMDAPAGSSEPFVEPPCCVPPCPGGLRRPHPKLPRLTLARGLRCRELWGVSDGVDHWGHDLDACFVELIQCVLVEL